MSIFNFIIHSYASTVHTITARLFVGAAVLRARRGRCSVPTENGRNEINCSVVVVDDFLISFANGIRRHLNRGQSNVDAQKPLRKFNGKVLRPKHSYRIER